MIALSLYLIGVLAVGTVFASEHDLRGGAWVIVFGWPVFAVALFFKGR